MQLAKHMIDKQDLNAGVPYVEDRRKKRDKENGRKEDDFNVTKGVEV